MVLRAARLQRKSCEVQADGPSLGALEQAVQRGVVDAARPRRRAGGALRGPSSRARRPRPRRRPLRRGGGPSAAAGRPALRARDGSQPVGAGPPRRSCRGSRRCGATRRGRGRARQAPSSQRSHRRRATRRLRPSDHPQRAVGARSRSARSARAPRPCTTPTVRGRCRAGRATARRSGKDDAATTRPATSSSRSRVARPRR